MRANGCKRVTPQHSRFSHSFLFTANIQPSRRSPEKPFSSLGFFSPLRGIFSIFFQVCHLMEDSSDSKVPTEGRRRAEARLNAGLG